MSYQEKCLFPHDGQIYDVTVDVDDKNPRIFSINNIKNYDSFEVVEIDSDIWKALAIAAKASRDKMLDDLDAYHRKLKNK